MSQVLHKQPGLVKKWARFVPKLLSDDQMAERVQTSQALTDLVSRVRKSVLDRNITMDESTVSMHTLNPISNPSSGFRREFLNL
jgi:hypothetical protein